MLNQRLVMPPCRSLTLWIAFVGLFALTATEPAHTTTIGPKRVYMIAPVKAGDDWGQFVSNLKEYESSLLQDADVQASSKKFSEELCDTQANCDVVTIEKSTERTYNFRIRKNSAHSQKYACSSCGLDTPIEQCAPAATSVFMAFIIQDNQCHQDKTKCIEQPCR